MLVVVGSRLKAGGETGGLFRPGSCFHDLQDNGGTEDVHSCLGHLFLSYHTTTITNFVKLIGPKFDQSNVLLLQVCNSRFQRFLLFLLDV